MRGLPAAAALLLLPLVMLAILMVKVRWTLVVYEFLDNDQFSNLDTLMLQLAPGQCLLSLDAGAIEGKPRGDMAKVMLCSPKLVTLVAFPAG